MSHTKSAALRAIYALLQIGSKLERSACGTRRTARAATRCEIAGVARPIVAVAPAAVFKNVLRSMVDASVSLALLILRAAGSAQDAEIVGECPSGRYREGGLMS